MTSRTLPGSSVEHATGRPAALDARWIVDPIGVGEPMVPAEELVSFEPYLGDWLDPQFAPILIAIILFAVLGTMILFTASVVVYHRRRTPRHFLVVVVVGALVARSIVGLGTVFGITPMVIHHLIEHGFDFLIAVVLLYAVYRGRSFSGEGV